MKKTLLIPGVSSGSETLLEVARNEGWTPIIVSPDSDLSNILKGERHYVADIRDKETLEEIAKKENVTAILPFGIDPAVTPAAEIATNLGLYFAAPLESVRIMQNKSLWRQWLRHHGFATPGFLNFTINCEDDIAEAINSIEKSEIKWPLIIKPAQSAGSKGITKVHRPSQLGHAIKKASSFCYDNAREIIVEEKLPDVYQSGSDILFINGYPEVFIPDTQIFDPASLNPFTPAAHLWPSLLTPAQIEAARKEIARAAELLQIDSGLFNVEFRVDKDNNIWIMEMSPRAGGNRIAETMSAITDFNFLSAAIKCASGVRPELPGKPISLKPGKHLLRILHSNDGKTLSSKDLPEWITKATVIADNSAILVNEDYPLPPFSGANRSLGTILYSLDASEYNFKSKEPKKSPAEEKRLKILTVVSEFEIGGAQKVLTAILPEICKQWGGAQITLLWWNASGRPLSRAAEEWLARISVAPGIRIKNARSKSILGKIREIRNELKTHDLAHIHLFPALYIAGFASIGLTTPLVFTEHSTQNRRRKHGIFRILEKFIYGRFSTLTAVSAQSRLNLAKWLSIPESEIEIIPNPLPQSSGSSANTNPKSPLACSERSDRPIVIMPARFSEAKDHETLLRAFADPRLEKAALILPGSGPKLEESKNMASLLGIASRVEFTGEIADLRPLFLRASVGVLSSHWEGFGMAILEMMDAGLPVISTDLPGLRETAADAALMVRHKDPADLADAIAGLISKESGMKRRSLIEKGRKRANEFNAGKIAGKYTALYKALLGNLQSKSDKR